MMAVEARLDATIEQFLVVENANAQSIALRVIAAVAQFLARQQLLARALREEIAAEKGVADQQDVARRGQQAARGITDAVIHRLGGLVAVFGDVVERHALWNGRAGQVGAGVAHSQGLKHALLHPVQIGSLRGRFHDGTHDIRAVAAVVEGFAGRGQQRAIFEYVQGCAHAVEMPAVQVLPDRETQAEPVVGNAGGMAHREAGGDAVIRSGQIRQIGTHRTIDIELAGIDQSRHGQRVDRLGRAAQAENGVNGGRACLLQVGVAGGCGPDPLAVDHDRGRECRRLQARSRVAQLLVGADGDARPSDIGHACPVRNRCVSRQRLPTAAPGQYRFEHAIRGPGQGQPSQQQQPTEYPASRFSFGNSHLQLP